MWSKEAVLDILRKPAILAGVASILSAAAAGTVGYRVADSRAEQKYKDIATKEIEEAKKFYRQINKQDDAGEVLSPQEVLKERVGAEAANALVNYQGVPVNVEAPVETEDELVETVVVEKTTVERNVFERTAEDAPDGQGWSFETERARRSGKEPYIITEEEFMENEREYEQDTLTFYAGDNVLIDKTDEPIPDVESVVGEDNLTRFGVGSTSPDTVYICNDRMEMLFEIERSQGKFAHEVLGFIEHSDTPRIRKFRRYDEE